MRDQLYVGEADKYKGDESLSELIAPYLARWRFILVGFLCFVAAGLLYIRYAEVKYRVTARVLIRDESRGAAASEYYVFADIGILPTAGNVDNEIEILRSKTLLDLVADSLDLDVSYFEEGWAGRRELYRRSPIRLAVRDYNGTYGYIRVEPASDGNFRLHDEKSGFTAELPPGQQSDSPWGVVSVDFTGQTHDYPVYVQLKKHLGENPHCRIDIRSISKTSGVVELSAQTACPEKSQDMINTLVYFYNRQAIEEKRWVTRQTISFIDERLNLISAELEVVERDVEAYKRANNLTDLESEAEIYLVSGSEYDKRIAELEIRKRILSAIAEHVVSEANRFRAIPSDPGITDLSLTALIEEYNRMLISRRESALSMTDGNPIYRESDRQLNLLRNDILTGIANVEHGYDVQLEGLKTKMGGYYGMIGNLSRNEREFRGFMRRKEITESVYIYLLQKREESAITLSIVTPNARSIDPAYTSLRPVAPRKWLILAMAMLCGVLVPAGAVWLQGQLNVKINSREDLENLVSLPILGVIPDRPRKKGDLLIRDWNRSGRVEVYRLLAVNFQFLLPGDDPKVVMITSSIPSEGKSSFAANLALNWATLDKKVLLVDLDMRNSHMNAFLEMKPPENGISFYLSDSGYTPEEIVTTHPMNRNLDVVSNSVAPPNPIQLLAGSRLGELVAWARKRYDYILIETPPVTVVADALLVNRVCDATIYVTLRGVTPKSSLKIAEQLSREGKLKNMAYILKGVAAPPAYGYGYGCGA